MSYITVTPNNQKIQIRKKIDYENRINFIFISR